jgi:hypothetical protein
MSTPDLFKEYKDKEHSIKIEELQGGYIITWVNEFEPTNNFRIIVDIHEIKYCIEAYLKEQHKCKSKIRNDL